MAELTTEKTWILLYHLHIFHVENFLEKYMRTIIKNKGCSNSIHHKNPSSSIRYATNNRNRTF